MTPKVSAATKLAEWTITMTNNFAILRTAKLKSTSKIAAAGLHNARQMEVPNADPDGKNYLVAGSNDPLEKFNELMQKTGIKPRKNAVLAVELVTSFSPEMSGKFSLKEWTKANLEWIEKEFPKGSVLSAQLHCDESTPHMHIIVTPLVKKEVRGREQWRLSARDYLGGAEKLRALQDRYAEAMKPFALERGVKGSKAHHSAVSEFYKDLNKDIKAAEKTLSALPEPGMMNFKNVFSQLRKVAKKALVATGRLEKVQDRYKQMREHAEHLQQVINRFRRARGIIPENEALKLLTDASEQRQREIDAAVALERKNAENAQKARSEAIPQNPFANTAEKPEKRVERDSGNDLTM